MRRNEGTLDRVLRVLLGVGILAFVTSTPWAWLGLVPIATGISGWCPLYQLVGISTFKVARKA
jgi:hypothetical protein